jgi:hypothetical protein
MTDHDTIDPTECDRRADATRDAIEADATIDAGTRVAGVLETCAAILAGQAESIEAAATVARAAGLLDVASRLRALSRELSTLADADGRAAGSPRHTIALISDALNAACGLNICNINV